MGLALDSSGNLFIAELGGAVRKVTVPELKPSKTTAPPVFSVRGGTYAEPETVTISDTTPGAAIYIRWGGAPASTSDWAYHGPIDISGSAKISAICVAPGYLPSEPITENYTITSRPSAVITTVAGTGSGGLLGTGGPALEVNLGTPNSVAFDRNGNAYIADFRAKVVWKLTASTGMLSVFAGQIGISGYSGNGGPATRALFQEPDAVAVDSAGNVYISDTVANQVRKVSAATGTISAYAGNGIPSSGGNGGPAIHASLLNPAGLTLDGDGNLFVAEYGGGFIRKVTARTGVISRVAGGGKELGDGGPALHAFLNQPQGVAVDAVGNIYIADRADGRIRKVDADSGLIHTIAGNGNVGDSGDGGLATDAEVNAEDVAVDGAGSVYIANSGGGVRRVPAGGGTIETVAGNGYIGYSGDGGDARVASLCEPDGVSFDAHGSLYIADTCSQVVRKVTFEVTTAKPTFSLRPGTYKGAQTVTLRDSTPGATIYYTTDGKAPTVLSIPYTGPIKIGSKETILAIAVATGQTRSAVATGTYTITH